jgi:hypothetical protein
MIRYQNHFFYSRFEQKIPSCPVWNLSLVPDDEGFNRIYKWFDSDNGYG